MEREHTALDRAGGRRLTLARRWRGAQLGDRPVQLVGCAVREDAADAGVDLGRDQAPRPALRASARLDDLPVQRVAASHILPDAYRTHPVIRDARVSREASVAYLEPVWTRPDEIVCQINDTGGGMKDRPAGYDTPSEPALGGWGCCWHASRATPSRSEAARAGRSSG
jgi:hypothetical protein